VCTFGIPCITKMYLRGKLQNYMRNILGYGSFTEGKDRQSIILITHFHLLPSRKYSLIIWCILL